MNVCWSKHWRISADTRPPRLLTKNHIYILVRPTHYGLHLNVTNCDRFHHLSEGPITVTVLTWMPASKSHIAHNPIVVKLKNCPFGVNTRVELKNVTATWRQYRHICNLKHNPLYDASAVFARWELWLVLSTTASVQCSADCESEEVRYVHVTSVHFDLGHCWIITSVTFRDMSLVLGYYTIQAVW
jgi:hypothetical protein